MKSNKQSIKGAGKNQAIIIIGFLILCLLSLMNELLDLPHLFFGMAPTPVNWMEAVIELPYILLIGTIVIFILRVVESSRVKAEEHIIHLNSVLRAIRNVNQLIVIEKDRDILLQKVCDALTEARGYNAAWLGYLSDDKTFETVVGSGFGEEVSCFIEHVMSGDHPPCIVNAIVRKNRFVVVDKSKECGDCFFKSACSSKEAAIIRVEHGNKLLGLLAVSFASHIAVDEEEKGLLMEVAGDIGLALHSIALDEARVQAVEALRESEERYRSLIENSHEIVQSIAPDGKIMFVNKAWHDVLGYSAEELENITVFDIIHPDSLEHCKSLFGKVMSGEEVGPIEAKFISKGGTTIVIEGNAVPRYMDDKLYATQGFFRDVTKRKEAEEKILAYQEKLKQLASKLALAEERERRKIAGELHDNIAQSLALAKMKVGALEESARSPALSNNLGDIRRYLEDSIKTTRSIISELSPPILHDLGIEAALDWLLMEFQERHNWQAYFKDDFKPKPLDSETETTLFIVVRELFYNIVKHAGAKNITLSIERENDNIQITVHDDGVGFDASEKIKYPEKAGGFGLFSITERLDYFGGTFDVLSKPGEGTRAVIVMPIEPNNNSMEEKT